MVGPFVCSCKGGNSKIFPIVSGIILFFHKRLFDAVCRCVCQAFIAIMLLSHSISK